MPRGRRANVVNQIRRRPSGNTGFTYEIVLPPEIAEQSLGQLFKAELVEDGILLRRVAYLPVKT